MAAKIYDSTQQAFVDAETPKIHNGIAYVDSEGKSYDNGVWKEDWNAFNPIAISGYTVQSGWSLLPVSGYNCPGSTIQITHSSQESWAFQLSNTIPPDYKYMTVNMSFSMKATFQEVLIEARDMEGNRNFLYNENWSTQGYNGYTATVNKTFNLPITDTGVDIIFYWGGGTGSTMNIATVSFSK